LILEAYTKLYKEYKQIWLKLKIDKQFRKIKQVKTKKNLESKIWKQRSTLCYLSKTLLFWNKI